MRSATVHPSDSDSPGQTITYARKSLGFITFDSPVRKYFLRLVNGSQFDAFILMMIILNSISMASADYRHVNEKYEPVSQHSWRNRTIEIAEVIFMVIFVCECIMKIIAMGFIKGKHAYLRSAWNVFDFFVVIFR